MAGEGYFLRWAEDPRVFAARDYDDSFPCKTTDITKIHFMNTYGEAHDVYLRNPGWQMCQGGLMLKYGRMPEGAQETGKILLEYSGEKYQTSEYRRAFQDIMNELLEAQKKFKPFNTPHEGYAIILEELDELWDDIKSGRKMRSLEEARQVAAMAVRYILDISGVIK